MTRLPLSLRGGKGEMSLSPKPNKHIQRNSQPPYSNGQEQSLSYPAQPAVEDVWKLHQISDEAEFFLGGGPGCLGFAERKGSVA